jgi:hypothetical protein
MGHIVPNFEGRVIPKPAIGINIKGLKVVIALWMYFMKVVLYLNLL